MSIKSELLVGIIQEYIKSKEPIGSEFLKSQRNFHISSATIRNYFNILEKEGALFQPHISSGRIPTNPALHSYWKNVLTSLIQENFAIMNMNMIDSLSANYGLYCTTIPRQCNILEEIINFHNQYLILKFSRNETIIKFSKALLRFLESFKNMDIQDIIKVVHEVGAGELERKLLALEQVDFEQTSYRYGSVFLKDIVCEEKIFTDIFNAKALLKYENGIYFDTLLPSGYMAVIHDVSYCNEQLQETCQARMMCVGSLLTDYKGFYKELGFTHFA